MSKLKNLIKKMFKYGDFCKIKNDTLKEHGLEEGDVVFIGGTQHVPSDEEDIYNQRMIMIVAPLIDNHVQSGTLLAVDSVNLRRVTPRYAKKLEAIMQEDFGEKEETNEAVN